MGGAGRQTRDQEERRRRFRARLRAVIAERHISQTALAIEFGVAHSTLNQWVAGPSVPEPHVVFDLEAHLELPPGTLSAELGYLPLSVRDLPTEGVEAALAADPRLDNSARRLLTLLYRETIAEPVVNSPPTGRRRRG